MWNSTPDGVGDSASWGGAVEYPTVARTHIERLIALRAQDPHAILGAHLLEQGAVCVEQTQPFLYTRRWQGALQVLRIRQRVFGLFAVEFDDAQQRP